MDSSIVVLIGVGVVGALVGGVLNDTIVHKLFGDLFGLREKEKDVTATEEVLDEMEREADQADKDAAQRQQEYLRRKAERKKELARASNRELAARLSRALERGRRDAGYRAGTNAPSRR